jgi:hypothetical protein
MRTVLTHLNVSSNRYGSTYALLILLIVQRMVPSERMSPLFFFSFRLHRCY